MITEAPNEFDNRKTPKQTFSKIRRSKDVECKLYSGVSVGLSPIHIFHILLKHIKTLPGLKGPILQILDSESRSNSPNTAHVPSIEEQEAEYKKTEIKQEIEIGDISLEKGSHIKELHEEDDGFNDSTCRASRFENLTNGDGLSRLADSMMAVANAINRYCDIIERK